MTDAHEKLRAYNLALAIDDRCYKLVQTWKPFDRDTTGLQLIRATGSIGANIAEGLGRQGKEPRRFAIIAQGSLREVRHWIEVAHLHDLIPGGRPGDTAPSHLLHELCDELARELHHLIVALGKKGPQA
jgi:four helix bundle protein